MTTPATIATIATIASPTLDRRGSSRRDDGTPTPETLRAAGRLRDVDVHFARVAARLAGEHDPLVLLGLALASCAPGMGHVCVDLARPTCLSLADDDGDEPPVEWPEVVAWRDALARSTVVADPARWARGDVARPLVLDGDRLYVARYWAYERALLGALRTRAAVVRDDVDEAVLRAGLARLFPTTGDGLDPDMQRVAACAAVMRGLTIITGGPGTGKTTTVLRVLALLVEQALQRGASVPRIALAAPTGKAAARLGAALRDGLTHVTDSPEVARALGVVPTTVHRLLGVLPRTPTRFRHDAQHPLRADVVIVDEVSMADLALTAKLVDAVPPSARLILLGDRDQLASVEAGSILGDVCGDARNVFSSAFATRLARACDEPRVAPSGADTTPAVADCVVRLVRSHRFGADTGIGALARAINDGDADAAMRVLQAAGARGESPADVALLPFAGVDRARPDLALLRRVVLPRVRTAVAMRGPKPALDVLDGFRVLTAHREGPSGVAGLNASIVSELVAEGSLPRGAIREPWFAGQPVLVTVNDPSLDLYNGDVGVVLPEVDGSPRAWFRSADGRGVRGIAPARLPAHETVFAMTVHKAQGSEFDEVVLVLPARPSRVLARELLYTAVSRAKTRVTILGSEGVLRAAIEQRVHRASGLRDALWPPLRPGSSTDPSP